LSDVVTVTLGAAVGGTRTAVFQKFATERSAPTDRIEERMRTRLLARCSTLSLP